MSELFSVRNIKAISGSVFCDTINYELCGSMKAKIMDAKSGTGCMLNLEVKTLDQYGNELPNNGGLYVVSPRPDGQLVESIFVAYEGGEVYADIV